MTILYDKTGAAFTIDHEIGNTAYVRPMVKVLVQTSCGDDYDEIDDHEPAEYLIARNRSDLFDTPPIEVVNEEIKAKRSELDLMEAEARRVVMDINSKKASAERDLQSAKHQLEEWMKTHRVMMDLGKLLDGQVLYPLSFRENSYHHARDIPHVPKMEGMAVVCITSGNFETGKPWQCKNYGMDIYGSPFQFFYTEEERYEKILSEFNKTCAKFRVNPNFDTTSHTTTTTLHYGTLMEWVKHHQALSIPEDIEAMKHDHDAEMVKQRKEKLVTELATMESEFRS